MALAIWRAGLTQRHLQRDTSRECSSSQLEDMSCRFRQLAFAKTPIFFPLTPHESGASLHWVPACSIAPRWVQIPQRQRASHSITLGSALHGCCSREGAGRHPGPGDLYRGKEAASCPSTQGWERKPQTENCPQTPRKREAAGGPCELSGSSWEARCALGVCKLTSHSSNTACEHRCVVEGSPAPLHGCACSFRSPCLISTSELPPDSFSKTLSCAKAPLSSHSPPLRVKENGEPRSTAAKRQVWEERQKAPGIYFYICCCWDQSEQQGRHGEQSTKHCCNSRPPKNTCFAPSSSSIPYRKAN